MKLYQATVYYSRPAESGFTLSAGLPTFYLRDDMQCITDELHAAAIVRHMLTALAPDAAFHVHIAVSAEFDPCAIGA